jgi:hypothetical protein
MSSTNIQREEIKALLEVIAEQTDTLLSFKDGQIPQIELDLVRESIRKLYSNYTLLDKFNSKLVDRLTDTIVEKEHPIKLRQPETPKEEIVPEKPVAEVIAVVVPEIVPEAPAPVMEKPEEVKVAEPEIIEQPIVETIPEPVIETKAPERIEPSAKLETPVETTVPIVPKKVAEPVKEEPKATKPVKTPQSGHPASTGNLFAAPSTSLADKFKDEKKSLHDKIGSSKADLSYVEKQQQKPIADLVKSIGINEKFLFIKELFKNNGEEYNEAIQLLNNFTTITQAFDYMDILKQKYGWDETSDASLKLFDMIRRKYQK